jgi:extradiol dioxygenase family protein
MREFIVLTDGAAFSGFAVPDLDAARRFYEESLGLRVEAGTTA